MHRLTLVGPLTFVWALSACLAGCTAAGSAAGSTGSGSTASSSADSLGVWQEFAACARTHGVPNLPDPQLNAAGKATFPGYDGRSMPDTVRSSCQRILERLPADSRPSANPAPTDIAALLRFAQCMRQHGLPTWPDPKSDGTFPASQLPGSKTPVVLSAMKACDSVNPDKAGRVYGS